MLIYCQLQWLNDERVAVAMVRNDSFEILLQIQKDTNENQRREYSQ